VPASLVLEVVCRYSIDSNEEDGKLVGTFEVSIRGDASSGIAKAIGIEEVRKGCAADN
jgi:hypothetical protein